MNIKIGSPTVYSIGLKSARLCCNIHTCFPIIASNVSEQNRSTIVLVQMIGAKRVIISSNVAQSQHRSYTSSHSCVL